MTFASRTLVENLTARNVAVAEHIDAVYMNAAPTPRERVLPFDAELAVADQVFGREAVMQAVEAWRASTGHGYFDLVAEAGLGKSALAARIARERDAVCFFASSQAGLTRADQFLTHASAALIVKYGLDYERLPENVGSDASAFVRILKQAANTVSPARGVWIVVDGLDEADPPAAEANPLLLPAYLPELVYVVVTHRPGVALSTLPGIPVDSYEIRRDDADQSVAVEAFLRGALATWPRLAQQLSVASPPLSVEGFVASVKAASEGNFMYASYLLQELGSRKPTDPPFKAENLPQGLNGYYNRFWSSLTRVRQSVPYADWEGLYRRVIEHLGVALEPVSVDWLARHVGREAYEVRERALEPWERLLGRERHNGSDYWRVVHRSFADFLATKVDLGATHRDVADSYAVKQTANWAAWDSYGLKHTVTHYANAAASAQGDTRREIVAHVVTLTSDANFQTSSLERLADPAHVERDLALAMRTACGDEDPRSIFSVTDAALALLAFRRQQRRPRRVFELAERGEVVAADRSLDAFVDDLDDDWHQALLLIVAWLGAARKLADARRLVDRVRSRALFSPTLQRLLEYVDAAVNGAAMPPSSVLAPPPTVEMAEAIVARLSGIGFNQSLLAGLPSYPLFAAGAMSDYSPGYLATRDGPLLVSLVVSNPLAGEPLLSRYLRVHSAYGYRVYRNGSLWALLDAVVRHPNPEWVRVWAAMLGEAVLGPNRGDFQGSLELAALGRAALLDGAALAELDQGADTEVAATMRLLPGFSRGEGDVWGTHKRRLCALAETLVVLPNRHSRAVELLERAAAIEIGFAGFSASAALRLAESVHIVTPTDALSLTRALDVASKWAHNINDPTFCAGTTARVNALRERWWLPPQATPSAARATAARLLEDSAGAAFAAVHHVGEGYGRRDLSRTVPLPPELLGAATLEDLARVYERPISDFVRLNPTFGPDQTLSLGTLVNVPDAGFAPFIATCLAAQAIANEPADPNGEAAARAIHPLIPTATRDVTALDTLLARLVRSAAPLDLGALRRLRDLAAANRANVLDDDDDSLPSPTMPR